MYVVPTPFSVEVFVLTGAIKAEEPPTAMLYAQAAFLSELKGARRRAALWYLIAADKLEKTGIVSPIYLIAVRLDGSRFILSNQKPLAMYLFRKAHTLYQDRVPKELSPSFWESEDHSPMQWEGFSAILPGIEHELGKWTQLHASGGVLRFPRSTFVYHR